MSVVHVYSCWLCWAGVPHDEEHRHEREDGRDEQDGGLDFAL